MRQQGSVGFFNKTGIAFRSQWASHPVIPASLSLTALEVELHSVECEPFPQGRLELFALPLFGGQIGLPLGLIPGQGRPPDDLLHLGLW